MSQRVTQDMVFLYAFGELSEADRRLVEQEYRTDLQVRDWFARLGRRPHGVAEEAPIHIALGDELMREAVLRSIWVEPDEFDHPEIASPPVQVRLQPPPVTVFLRLPENQRQASPAAAALRLYDPRGHGGSVMHGSFPRRLAGATVKATEFPLSRQATDHVWQDGDRVRLDCPESSIPHGLGWLILTEGDGVVTLRLPELSFDHDVRRRWGFKCNVEKLLDERRPARGELHVVFLPATEETREAFDDAKVRAFVASLSRMSTQRERAEKFLATLE